MGRRKGGLYRMNEQGQEELVHRTQPGAINPPDKKKEATKAKAKPAAKLPAKTTGGDAS